MQSNLDRRKRYDIKRTELLSERSSFEPHWRDLSEYILPRRSRFFVSDSNKGDSRNQKIIDSSATFSARTLRSGMMAGVTSPARPWFELSTQDEDLANNEAVKEWLSKVTKKMTSVFLKSNLYNVLPIMYGDLGVFSTAAMLVEEDITDTVRFYPFPIGSYAIANDHKLKVNTFFREFRMTVRQVVTKFALDPETEKINWDLISTSVRNLYDEQQFEAWINVTHVIEPNAEHDPKKLDSKFKKYISVYYESGSGPRGRYTLDAVDRDKFLREKGYDYFPVLAPRWEISGEDVYGTSCPGMESLGDIKQLQVGEKRSAQAVEKQINPPMTGPATLKNQKTSILPGDITYTDEREGQKGFRPAHTVSFDISQLEVKQAQVRERIRRAFFEDLFLMLASSDRRQITAREIDERHEEKLLALGPVLEQLNQDLLDPLIDITFDIMIARDDIPPPPEELAGQDLKIVYVSIMAQAQKLSGVASIERLSQFVAEVAQGKPEVLDKINSDKLIDIYGDTISVPYGIIIPDEEANEIRGARAQAQQQQQQAEQAQMSAQTAQTLSQTPLEEGTALNELQAQSEAGRIA